MDPKELHRTRYLAQFQGGDFPAKGWTRTDRRADGETDWRGLDGFDEQTEAEAFEPVDRYETRRVLPEGCGPNCETS